MRSRGGCSSLFGSTRRHAHFITFFVLIALLYSGCSSPSSPRNDHATQPRIVEQQDDAGKFKSSLDSNPIDARLARDIDRLIDAEEFASARLGVNVISLRDARTVYERNADKLFTPASNMKLFPTAVGLELLGADYRWRTSVYAATQPDAAGTLNGDLVLYGRGAPDLVAVAQTSTEANNSLTQLANDLYDRGLRRIKGNVIGDESYFRGETLGDGWQWNDVQWYFGAEASALSINNNEVSVSILPPDKTGTPPVIRVNDVSGYVTVENRMAVVKPSERMTVGMHRGLSDNVVRIWGTFPFGSKGFGVRLAVYKPALWAAKIFSETLKARGITVEGTPEFRDARQPIAERFDPSRSIELAYVTSKPLSEIIKATNKLSINFYAELILRTLGRERGTLLSAPESAGRERGDDEIGLMVIRQWLSRSGIPPTTLALHDGSGLSRLNLVTPRSLSGLLAVLSKSSSGQTFRESLPVSGRDGTLGHRLKEHAERVSAKTGYLTYDTSLSGYVTTTENEVLVFSIICNDETGRANSGRLIDEIVSLLAAYPAISPQKEP